MVDNKKSDSVASRGKRYTIGEMFKTAATLGLKLTDADRNPTCQYQFTRKTDVDGIMDVPFETPVRYVAAKAVYAEQPSSKRMIFRIAKGTNVTLNGVVVTLEEDVDVAGVVNHIDHDDPYNVKHREAEVRRASKDVLKAQAQAVKIEAA